MKLLLWFVRLYPKAWRDRYQVEFIAMLEQYEKPRVSDILDVILGAIKAHLQAMLQSKKRMQSNLLKGGLEKMMVTEENLDRAHAQKWFEEGIKEHQLPIEFHDVDFAPSFKDQQNTLTFYFYADEKIDLLPLMKHITGVYEQKIQMIQVGKLKHKEKARNYLR
jgi:hypothetical protein